MPELVEDPLARRGVARASLRPHVQLDRDAVTALMPYAYCVVLGTAIAIMNSSVLVGTDAIDIRATAVLPLALVAFGQTLVVLQRVEPTFRSAESSALQPRCSPLTSTVMAPCSRLTSWPSSPSGCLPER